MVDAGQQPQPQPEPGRVPGDGQLPLWWDEDGGGSVPVLVRPGEAAGLVATFAQAQELAARLWRLVAGCELSAELRTITASVSEHGHPCVHLEFTERGARALLQALLRDPLPGVRWVRDDSAA